MPVTCVYAFSPRKNPFAQGRRGKLRGTTLIGGRPGAQRLSRDGSHSWPGNGGKPSPVTCGAQTPLLSPAQLPGEFGLCRYGAPRGHRSPGFHLVFPGSLRGWPTTPVRSLAIRFQRRTRWTRRDLNPRPPQCHCGALPTALRAHAGMILVDPEGLEPSTPTMPLWCAPNCATGPRCADNGTGGAEGTRTPGLYSAIVALSHLSYSPTATGTLCQAVHVVYENPLSCQVEGFGASHRLVTSGL